MIRTCVAVLAVTMAASFMTADVSYAATKKKDVRDSMTAEQKKELRRRARDWCAKKYAVGAAYIDRIQIQSNGSVICYVRTGQ